ncbi:flavin reductase family protein [Mycobacterium intracellulare]|uniref:flavin reductase family protein n=1 Tax=Mycobacterium intracellulare TaxID=1767 RepID=UPI001CDA7C8F|nr:flavin reductase family protein [Mycobacterium intracellulare]MCA2255996.1 flavin reductase family protein [Mycobacterium intracellulare]
MTPRVAIDAGRFRRLMTGVCAPVTIVTAMHNNLPHGATVSSFASLSLDPPLISIAFQRTAMMLQRVHETGRFGVNLLGQAQEDLARLFAQPGADRFANTAWRIDTGLPRLDSAAGWVVCELYREVDAGDHVLLFGLVTDASTSDLPPLVYAHRTFGTHSGFNRRPRPPIVDQIAACSY